MSAALLTGALLLLVACASPLADPGRPAGKGTSTVQAFDGERIVVERVGEREVRVVLIHGWGTERGIWRRQAPALAARYGLVLVDLPGHGEASSGRGQPSLGALARDVAEVLVTLDLSQVVLVGHSMGGLVALEAAALEPERVRGVVGVECFLDIRSQPDRAEWDALRRSFQMDFTATCANFTRTMFRSDVDPGLRQSLVDSMAAAPPLQAVELLEDILYHDEEGALERARVPVRCLNADLRPTFADRNRAVARDYDLRVLSESGHFLMLEQPLAFNRLLAETLEELLPTAP